MIMSVSQSVAAHPVMVSHDLSTMTGMRIEAVDNPIYKAVGFRSVQVRKIK